MVCYAAVSIRKSLLAPPRSKPIISFITRAQTNTSSSSVVRSSSIKGFGHPSSSSSSPSPQLVTLSSSVLSSDSSSLPKRRRMSSTSNENTSTDDNKFVIFAIAGSQFVFKVLAAIESRKLDHYVELVSMDTKERAKILNRKDGKASVPVLCSISKNDSHYYEQIEDSEDILHWVDTNYGTDFFPSDTSAASSEVSVRASDKTLAAMVWYYNWVDYTGYSKSMKVSVAKFFGPLSFILPTFVIDLFVKSTRDKFRYQVKKVLEIENENDSLLDDEKQMRLKLIEELKYFQSLLITSEQEYLISGTTEPTAADFSVYAQLERLVGESLTASDYDIQPAILELKYTEPTKDSLCRLWKWHDNIRTKFPVHFRGKRPPKDILEKIQKQQQQTAATQSKL